MALTLPRTELDDRLMVTIMRVTPEQEQLVLDHMVIVQIYARRHWGMWSDAVAVGYEILCRSAVSFDPSLGWKFSTYFEHKLRGGLIDAFREMTHGRRKLNDSMVTFTPFDNSTDACDQLDIYERQQIEDDDEAKFLLAGLKPRLSAVAEMLSDGYTMVEVGRVLGVTESRVSQMMKLARKHVECRRRLMYLEPVS